MEDEVDKFHNKRTDSKEKFNKFGRIDNALKKDESQVQIIQENWDFVKMKFKEDEDIKKELKEEENILSDNYLIVSHIFMVNLNDN